MAHNKVTIDVEARFVDNVGDGAKAAASSLDKIEKEAKEAQTELNKIGKKPVKPKIEADDSKLAKKLDNADKKLSKIGRTKARAVLDVLDRATSVITKALNKGKNFANKVFKGTVAIADKATSGIEKVMGLGKRLAGKTWTTVVKIKDYATAPLKKLKDMLFSIRSLVVAVTAGLAAKQLVVNPVGLADSYSSAKIGFQTLLGDQQGQQLMNDLDVFAKETPFKSSEVISQTQRMIAMGWDAEDIIDDMTTIGDAAAATGKGEQGLQQIVTALAQIKTKGKLSTEELNQLAEAGISAKRYIAEGLGYGSGDEGIAKMTEDLEDGAISAGKALEALLSGMQEYQGMMDKTANETVQGLWSQIEDTFEINIFRRWGQGLQDGAKKSFGSIVKLLEEADGALTDFGDTVYEVGKKISNWLADKLEGAVERITEITGSFDFKNASLKEKVSMLWNGVIVDPLKEWWEGGGQQKTVETAGKIGEWMGGAITKGLLAIFGMTDILDDGKAKQLGESGGMSIAQSFADGFMKNFDGSAITDAFVQAISNVWNALPTWAKILLGVYGGGKAITGIGNVVSAAATVIGSRGTVGAGNVITGASGLLGLIGRTGVAGVGSSGILGTMANTGYTLMGGTSALSVGGGAAALAGGLGIAGGVAGAVSAGKGIYDLYGSYKAYKSGDKIEGKAKAASGGTTLGGVGAGAAAGAAIGSVIPGLGTALGALIGAGIGGVSGWIGGEKWAENIREAKYEVEGTAEAIENAATEEEKLAALNEAAWTGMKNRMGNIKLTAAEIERLATQVVWGSDLANFDKFTAATKNAEASLQSLKTAAEGSNKWMWKASLGVKFNEDEIEDFKATFKEYINSAKTFVENKHYEFTAAVSLLVDVNSDAGKNILESGNSFYDGVMKELDALYKEQNDALYEILKDGVVSTKDKIKIKIAGVEYELNEQEALSKLQAEIASITEKVANAEQEAELQLIKVKFGSGNLDLDSFDAFMKQMENTLNERITANDDAFKASVATLQLELEEGAITEDEYNKQLQTLVDGYTGKVDKVKAEIMDVELEIIGEAYSNVLGKDATQKLQSALEKSLADGINPIEWTPDRARKYLGIDDLKDDVAVGIATMLGGVANQIELVEVDGKLLLDLGVETKGDTGEKVKDKVDRQVPDAVNKEINLALTGKKYIENNIEILADEFGIPDSKAEEILWKLNAEKSVENKIDVIAKEFGISESEAATILWKLTGDKNILNTIALSADDFGIPDVIRKTVKIKVTGSVTTTGNPKMDYDSKQALLYNQEQGFRGGIFGGGSSSLEAFATGGIVRGGARLIKVAEEGTPEMVIPLGLQRRERGLKLWEKAGQMLGVPGFSRGGLTDGSQDEGIRFHQYRTDEAPGDQTVQIDVGGITVEIVVHATEGQSVVEAIKEQANEIAEVVAGVMTEALNAQFTNTPLRGGAY